VTSEKGAITGKLRKEEDNKRRRPGMLDGRNSENRGKEKGFLRSLADLGSKRGEEMLDAN